MRVLITGITGFLGRHLARHLVARGHDVRGFASSPPDDDALPPQVRTRVADLTDIDDVVAAVAWAAPQRIVHLGALSHVGTSWRRPGDYLRVNVAGTHNLLRAVEAWSGPPVRLLFASSAEVYGQVPPDAQPIAEDRPVDPRSPYAMTKASGELVARTAGAVIVRLFNVVGPGQATTFALPSFAHQLATIALGENDDAVLRVGDLSPRRDVTPVGDAVEGLRLALERGEGGTVYNLASGRAHSIRDLLDALIARSGVAATIEVDPERVRPVDIPQLCGDAGRLRALGWSPRADGLDAVLDALYDEARERVVRGDDGRSQPASSDERGDA
ncbi:MAG: GDP-mannose 4,6-dehydratase [Acidobacteriota bacterium]